MAVKPAEDSCLPVNALAKGLSLLQEKWVLFIVKGLLDGPLGFNEISRRANGVNTTTLSQRMDLLELHGVVEKTVHRTMPPKVSYTLTEKGRALGPVIKAVQLWADRFMAG